MKNNRPSTIDKPPSPARARRKREIAERRANILAAAHAVFFERGLYRATVDEIAERAEIAKGTVYLYFSSKETILAYVLIDGLAQMNEELSAADTTDETLPPDERVRRLAQAYLGFFEAHPQYLEMMMASDRGNFQESVDPLVYRQVLERSLRGLHRLTAVIDAGIRIGHYAPGNAKEKAAMIWSAVNGALVLYAHPLRRDMLNVDVATLYNGVLDLMLKGLRA